MIGLFCLLISTLILFIVLKSSAEEYNLFGEAGQAYAIEIQIGHPYQKLNVIVDTGSATLAIASYPRPDNDQYFYADNSSSIYESGQEVQAKYSQGMWVGKLVSDYVSFPSLSTVKEVRSDIALITKSHNFFMNGSGWQGLLGLAYLPVGAWGDNVIVGSWLDSLNHMLNKQMSFELKLCGVTGPTNATHYGNLRLLDEPLREDDGYMFRTPVLRKRWFVVGVLSIRVMTTASDGSSMPPNSSDGNVSGSEADAHSKYFEIDRDVCRTLNEQKSIVDSGTTNIRLPDELFGRVVNEFKSAAQKSNVLILDEFWYHGEAACWPEPQVWSLPWLAIDLLDADAENQYFTLEIPPQNYMRVVSARNSTGGSETFSEFCYKLGLEAGGTETVLGYTAMEGFEVLFNRSAGWIGWKSSNCGPSPRISGPHNTSVSLLIQCKLIEPVSDVSISIKAAQWTLFVISMIALGVLVYLLAPCVKMMLAKPLPRTQQISLSQAALVDQEGT